MFYVLQNESVAARKRCPILLTDSATGTTGQSGLAISSIYPYVSINGGAFAGGAGTIAEVNFGQYYYEFDASEINTLGLAGIHITAPGCRDYDAIVQVAAFNMYSVAGAGLTAGDVWSYGGGRTTTGGIADTVVNPVDVKTTSMASIASTVWNTDVSSYTDPSAGYDLTQAASGGAGISAADVWSFDISGILGSNEAGYELLNASTNSSTIVSTTNDINTNTQPAAVALSVWGNDLAAGSNSPYAAGTAGTILYDLSLGGSGLTAGDVWDFNITGFGNTGSAAEYVTQTNFNVGNIEVYVANQTPQDVWTYAGVEGRTITGGTANTVTNITNPVSVSTASMTGIAGTVWSTDVSSYTSPSAGYDLSNATAGGGITAGDIWTYATRTITGGIADTVTSVTNGVIVTTNNDKTGYSLSGTQSFNLTGNITGNLSGSVGSVTSPVTFDSSQYAAIASSVWNAPTRTLTSGGSGISAADVWTYGTRTITGGIADTVTTVSGNVLGSVNSVVSDVNVSTASMTGIAGTVWSVASRTITGGIADTVTTVTNRAGFAITGGTITTVSDKTGYSLSATQTFDLTGNITGNVSGSVGSVAGNVSGSVASVVGNVGGNVAGSVASVSGNVGGNVVGSVASVTAPVSVATSSMTGIAGTVWSYGTRTLTSGGSGISAYDVWNFVLSDANTAEVDLVQAASGAGLTAGDVWTYASRTITGGIANTVTNVTNGVTVTTNNDKSGYSLSSSQSFNLTGNITGNLSGSVGSVSAGVTVTTNNDKTGYALSGAGVSAVQSGLSTLTQAQVGTEVDSSLADVGLTSTVTGRIDVAVSSRLASASYVVPPTEAAIAGTVWGYATRTLTSGAGATAGDVWNYPTRSLTSGAGITVNAATNIINGPYFVKSNVDSQDGTLDVIRGMVQDIQLTVTDAFQNPFDVTALGLAVNFYDQAGTLTTSYGTTELYGPAGLVQFTLDTAVTANEGRYNLILSAAGSGNTIKFGPLQTLVRPF
jgi:hypothetical protein